MNKKILFLILFGVLISSSFVYAECYTAGNHKLNSDNTVKTTEGQVVGPNGQLTDNVVYYTRNSDGKWIKYDQNGKTLGVFTEDEVKDKIGEAELKRIKDNLNKPTSIETKPIKPAAKTSEPKAKEPVIPDAMKDAIKIETDKEGKKTTTYDGEEVKITRDSSGGYSATDKEGNVEYYTRDFKGTDGSNLNVKCKGGETDCSFSRDLTSDGKRNYENVPELSGNFKNDGKGVFTNDKGDKIEIFSNNGMKGNINDGKTAVTSTKDGIVFTTKGDVTRDGKTSTETTSVYTYHNDGTRSSAHLSDDGKSTTEYSTRTDEDGRTVAYKIGDTTYSRTKDGDSFCIRNSKGECGNDRFTIDDLAKEADKKNKGSGDDLKSDEITNNILTGNADFTTKGNLPQVVLSNIQGLGKALQRADEIYSDISGNNYWLNKWGVKGWGADWTNEVADALGRSFFSEERFAGQNWCSEWFSDENAPVTIIPGSGGTSAGHIEGRRAEAYYEENGEPKLTYVYTITLSIDPSRLLKYEDNYVEAKVFVSQTREGAKKYIKIDGETDLIKIKGDSGTYKKDGSDAIQQVVSTLYEYVCIDFSQSFDRFTVEVQNLMDNDPTICNTFVGDVAKSTDETGIFGLGAPSYSGGDGSGGEEGDSADETDEESRPDTVNPSEIQNDFS